MSCNVEEDLTAYLDRELPAERAQQVEQHLDGCRGCRETVALLRSAIAPLASLPALDPSPALRRAVLHRIDEEPGSLLERWRGFWRPRVWVPALALTTVVAVAHAVSQRREDPETLLAAGQLELAANLEVLEDLDVVGLEAPEDLDVIEHLDVLEAMP